MKLSDFGIKNAKDMKTTGIAIIIAIAAAADLWYFKQVDHMYIFGSFAVSAGLLIAPNRLLNLGFKKAGEGKK